MDLTKREIASDLRLPVNDPVLWPLIKQAMETYAKQEMYSFASWLAHQPASTMTRMQLWNMYRSQVLDQDPDR